MTASNEEVLPPKADRPFPRSLSRAVTPDLSSAQHT